MTTIHWAHLNWFDYVIVGLIALSMLISFFRGFIREAISLLTWIVALLISIRFAEPLSNHLGVFHVDSPSIRYTIAFIILFIIILIIGFIVNSIMKYLIHRIGIGPMDRLLGIFFGVARGILAVAVILVIINFSPLKSEPWLTASQFTPKFNPLVQWLNGFLPKKVEQVSDWISVKALS